MLIAYHDNCESVSEFSDVHISMPMNRKAIKANPSNILSFLLMLFPLILIHEYFLNPSKGLKMGKNSLIKKMLLTCGRKGKSEKLFILNYKN